MHKISIIGLGYVGLPIAVSFARKFPVIAFDKNRQRIAELKEGLDRNQEICANDLGANMISFTDNEADIADANFHIVAVPTPIDDVNRPDLTLLKRATETVAKVLKKGDIVVFESTVYPGATEEDCLPILEQLSGLKCPEDFSIGYSPERINPGDKEHQLETIVKVVSGYDDATCDTVADVYGTIITAGVHKAATIKVAEAAKVIENTQRDLNISLMNELAIIFDRLNIDTKDVLEAAATKWNFLNFKPGLVGGHCIGVDPYYLTHKAEAVNYHPQVILAGRRINDNVHKYIVEQTVKLIHQKKIKNNPPKVGVLGITFKENCPDIRNSKVVNIVSELTDYGFSPLVHDPVADRKETYDTYQIELSDISSFKQLDVVIVAVAHDTYKTIDEAALADMINPDGIIVDIKSMFDKTMLDRMNLTYWRL